MGSCFTQWIKLLCAEQTAKIHDDSCQSNIIKIRKCIQQGHSLSPLLYNLVIEMMVLVVGQNLRICGISIMCRT